VARRGPEDRSLEQFLPHAIAFLAQAEWEAGEGDDAALHAELAVSLAESEERAPAYLFTHAVAATVLAHRGELDRAATHAQSADRWLTRFSGPSNAATVALARSTVAQAKGDNATVVAAVVSLPATVSSPQHDTLLAEAYVALGQLDKVALAVTRLETASPARASTRLDTRRWPPLPAPTRPTGEPLVPLPPPAWHWRTGASSAGGDRHARPSSPCGRRGPPSWPSAPGSTSRRSTRSSTRSTSDLRTKTAAAIRFS
jgi:hypothetical protein